MNQNENNIFTIKKIFLKKVFDQIFQAIATLRETLRIFIFFFSNLVFRFCKLVSILII